MPAKTTIKCPNCHTDIDVNEIKYYFIMVNMPHTNYRIRRV